LDPSGATAALVMACLLPRKRRLTSPLLGSMQHTCPSGPPLTSPLLLVNARHAAPLRAGRFEGGRTLSGEVRWAGLRHAPPPQPRRLAGRGRRPAAAPPPPPPPSPARPPAPGRSPLVAAVRLPAHAARGRVVRRDAAARDADGEARLGLRGRGGSGGGVGGGGGAAGA
jgi:hypothetical protein